MASKVARYYDDNVERELQRLRKSFYCSLERRIVLHLVDKYFSKDGRLLDAGSGPGVYTRELLEMGFDVTVADISAVGS